MHGTEDNKYLFLWGQYAFVSEVYSGEQETVFALEGFSYLKMVKKLLSLLVKLYTLG